MTMNKVCIGGNLTRDAELRHIDNGGGGFSVLDFGMAVNQKRRNTQTGEYEDDPVFVDCAIFGRRAEALAQYMTKGQKVFVTGRLRFSTYMKDDEKRSKLSVVAEDIDFGGYGSDAGNRNPSEPQAPVAAPPVPDVYDEDIPF